eukprot:UN18566
MMSQAKKQTVKENEQTNENQKHRKQESLANLAPLAVENKRDASFAEDDDPTKDRVYDQGSKGFLTTASFKSALKEQGATDDILDSLDKPTSPDFTYEDVHVLNHSIVD